MRVVGGALRGRTIHAPRGTHTRPTSDRVREALFSRLEALVGGCEDAVVLDAFAGSGALGIEALSRGAAHATFVDSATAAIRAVSRNIIEMGLAERATVVPTTVGHALAQGRLGTHPFTLLFLDPPYRISKSEVRALIEALAAAGLIAAGASVAWEYEAGGGADWPPGFVSLAPRRYGSTEVDIAVYDQADGADREDA